MKHSAILLVIALIISIAHSQAPPAFNYSESALYINLGMDPAVQTTIGIQKPFNIFELITELYGEVTLPAGDLDLGDYRVRLGSVTEICAWSNFMIEDVQGVNLIGTENWLHKAISLGAHGRLRGVYCWGKWSLGGEIGYDVATLTHLKATERYREFYYPEFKDGWYKNTSGRIHYGLVGSRHLENHTISIRTGFAQTMRFNDSFPPFYVELNVRRAIPRSNI